MRRSAVHKNCYSAFHIFWSHCPLLIFILQTCPADNCKTVKAINLKLHRWIDLIQEICSAQEPLLCISYFWSYCTLLIFILQACLAYASQTIKAINMKLHRWIDVNEEKCSAQELLLFMSYKRFFCNTDIVL